MTCKIVFFILLQWRRFNFFNKQIVDPGTSGRTWVHVQDRQFLCSNSGRGRLVFGDILSCVHSYLLDCLHMYFSFLLRFGGLVEFLLAL